MFVYLRAHIVLWSAAYSHYLGVFPSGVCARCRDFPNSSEVSVVYGEDREIGLRKIRYSSRYIDVILLIFCQLLFLYESDGKR